MLASSSSLHGAEKYSFTTFIFGFICSMKVTSSDNGITNAVEIYAPLGSAPRLACSNNDAALRVYDTGTFQKVQQVDLPWAVNCAAAAPGGGRALCVVGDDPGERCFPRTFLT
jgi:hypothetical protein